jgi:hypothetical protein
MARSRKLTVEVLADAKNFTKNIGSAGVASDDMGRKFKNMGRNIGIGLGAAAAGVAVFAKGAIDAASEAQSVQRKVAAVIKATGGASNVTAKHVDEFAESMAYKIGVDDEAIKTSAAMLLTFKAVRNESGKGNDIFDRAATSMMDLASVFGSSDAAAKQLGKALSDPVKGVSALKKAGVDFTQQQKDQIKIMVESGDLLGAQKLILGEVESQVGGTAAASATAGDKIKVAFGEVQEQIGTYLLPVVKSLSDWVVLTFIPAVKEWNEKHGPAMKKMFREWGDKIKIVYDILQPLVVEVLKKLGNWIKNNGTVTAVGIGVIAGMLAIYAVSMGLAAAATGAMNIALIVFDVVSAPFTVTGAVIIGIVGALFLAFKQLGVGINDVSGFFGTLWEWIKKIPGAFKSMANSFVPGLNAMISVVELAINVMIDGYNKLLPLLNIFKPGKDFQAVAKVKFGRIDPIYMGPTVVGNKDKAQSVNDAMDMFNNWSGPTLATGGIITSPMIAKIGEAGPEAIIPLRRGMGAGMGNVVNINVTASPLSSPADVGAAVVDALKAYERRNGSLRLRVS